MTYGSMRYPTEPRLSWLLRRIQSRRKVVVPAAAKPTQPEPSDKVMAAIQRGVSTKRSATAPRDVLDTAERLVRTGLEQKLTRLRFCREFWTLSRSILKRFGFRSLQVA